MPKLHAVNRNFNLQISTHFEGVLDPTRLGVDKVSLRFNVGDLLHAEKLWGGRGWWMTHEILVSAQGPFLGF